MKKVNDATSVRAVLQGDLKRLSAKRLLLAVLATAVLASGCASISRSLSPSDDLIATQIIPVMHYGAGIVIADYTIDDRFRGGFQIGWGGGVVDIAASWCPRTFQPSRSWLRSNGKPTAKRWVSDVST